MATVYLAEDLKHGRKVAVKVMRPELTATLGADRFLREIEIAARLAHPHVLPVHDSGNAGGVLYYVMPYVEGESLRDRVHREGRLPVDESVRLAREIAEALGYAHGRGIIHRDIKPANILLGQGHALVADFGIARATEGGAALTQTGLAVGTPQYMSPEQASGERDVDARADVYAIGAVLYEMLAGEPPYSGPTPQAVLAKSLTEEVRPLTSLRTDVPRGVAEVVTKAMARSPADRYTSAADLERALTGALDAARTGETVPVAAGPSTIQVWGLFGVAAVVTLTVIYGLVARWGLARWTLWLAAGLLAVGAAVLATTGRVEAGRRAGRAPTGITRWFSWRNATFGGALAGVLWVAVALTVVFRGPAAPSAGSGVRLAVLPFENRGDPADEYFVDGLADQVRGKLTGVAGFEITARTSSDQYRQSTKSPQEIGRELGVDYLLTATVAWAKSGDAGGRVQVIPELIDARTGTATWQQAFDAALTDVFQVQADIAVRVAGALNVALGVGEQKEITERPTQNLAAYDAFLKGEAARRLGGQSGLHDAAVAFEQAVALDSTFALAWARLAQVHAASNFMNPTPEDADGARRASERARQLAPDAPETHVALGNYYQNVLFDLPRASDQYAEGLRVAPNDPGLLVATANVERSLGHWDRALELLQRAQKLDPRSTGATSMSAQVLLWTRQYPETQVQLDKALALAPASMSLIEAKAMVDLAQGDLGRARAVIAAAPPEVEPTRLVAFVAGTWDLFWVLTDDQQRLLLRLSPGAFDNDRGAWGLALAATHALRGDVARARAYGDSAQLVYDEALRRTPDDNYLLALSGVALAYAGRKDEALRNGERSVELLPVTKDGFSGAYNLHLLARIYTILGQQDKAIDQLQTLLGVPYYLSRDWLKIDPTFDALRGNPRFERLIAGS